MTTVAFIPAKLDSRRVDRKNFKPFVEELSLVELKIITLLHVNVDRIILSSNYMAAQDIAKKHSIEFQYRNDTLCGEHTNLGSLFKFCLKTCLDDHVYWAHPTSPFVKPSTMEKAFYIAQAGKHKCTLGVQRVFDFLWDEKGPKNYDYRNQPRSQDLKPLFKITGGIHIARGRDYCSMGAVSFSPHKFIELEAVESVDINNNDEWNLAKAIAPETINWLSKT